MLNKTCGQRLFPRAVGYSVWWRNRHTPYAHGIGLSGGGSVPVVCPMPDIHIFTRATHEEAIHSAKVV